jgi:hypothetical protein
LGILGVVYKLELNQISLNNSLQSKMGQDLQGIKEIKVTSFEDMIRQGKTTVIQFLMDNSEDLIEFCNKNFHTNIKVEDEDLFNVVYHTIKHNGPGHFGFELPIFNDTNRIYDNIAIEEVRKMCHLFRLDLSRQMHIRYYKEWPYRQARITGL